MLTRRRRLLACVSLLSLTLAGCHKSSPTSETPVTSIPITITGTGATNLTYTTNIQPILASDCVICHGPTVQNAGHNFSSYSGVLRALTPGSDASPIVRMTQPAGPMFVNLSGDRNTKAGIIYDWVVNSKAAQ